MGATLIAVGVVLAVAPSAGAPSLRAGGGARAGRLSPLAARDRAGLAALLALALALRLFRLGSDLWYDEVVTLVEFVRLPAETLLTKYTTQNNHILYSLAAQLSVALFGESAWALRLPAALAGTACVGALFQLGRRVLDLRQAYLAAALLAVSYHHVWFSQNARGYTGLMLLTIVGTSVFLEGLRRPRRGLWFGYAAIVATALYVHLSAVFVFATHGLVYLAALAADRAGLRAVARHAPGAREAWPLLGFALGGLAALALYAVLLPQMLETFSHAAAERPSKVAEWTNPLWTALQILRGLPLGPASVGIVLAALGVGGLGFVGLARRDPLAVVLMAAPLPLTLAVLLAISFHVWPRYFFPSLGFAVLFGVHGLFSLAAFAAARLPALARPPFGAARLGTALALAAVALSALTLPANYRLPKQPYVAARELVEARRQPGDAVASAGLAAFSFSRYYAPEWHTVESAGELERLRAGAAHTWLVYSFPTYMRTAHPDLLEAAATGFEPVATLPGTLGDGEIHVLRSVDR